MFLTYNLMGIIESYSSNHEEASQSVEPLESTNSRKRKEVAEGSMKSKGKKIVNKQAAEKK